MPIEEYGLCCRNVGLSLDRLLHADHGVAPAVEEDVGGGGVGGTGDQLLCCRLYDTVVTVKPARVTCNHIVTYVDIFETGESEYNWQMKNPTGYRG